MVYWDRTPKDYHLSRSSSDNNNAGEEHKIYSGAANILSNYDITYIGNVLTIEKTDLPITALSVTRYYGTEKYVENGKTATDYRPQSAAKVVSGDVFSTLIDSYFDDAGQIFFYNTATETFSAEIVGYLDNWCVLYKNVLIYSDENCENLAGTLLQDITFEIRDIDYSGNYFAFPLISPIGTYYAVADISQLSLMNYTPTMSNVVGKEYSFTIEVLKTNVLINVKSFVVTGNGGIKDQNNASNGKYLAAYFTGKWAAAAFTDSMTKPERNGPKNSRRAIWRKSSIR